MLINDTKKDIKWLVSVRSASELQTIRPWPVDILDFKEPTKGPLAPVLPQVLNDAAKLAESLYDSSTLLSAALGEQDDMPGIVDFVPSSFAFAKVGPSNCRDKHSIARLWEHARTRLPQNVRLVAVAYADHDAANTVTPEEVFQLAADQGISHCLIDTFTKVGKSSLDWLGIERLRSIANAASGNGQWWALAGSISTSIFSDFQRHGIAPNCVGVRGDVCQGDRAGQLSEARLRNWANVLGRSLPIAYANS